MGGEGGVSTRSQRSRDRDSRDRKAEIESEWAEWQTGLVEQQAHAEINPRPDKEEEDDDGRLRDSSFIGPAVQGRVPP